MWILCWNWWWECDECRLFMVNFDDINCIGGDSGVVRIVFSLFDKRFCGRMVPGHIWDVDAQKYFGFYCYRCFVNENQNGRFFFFDPGDVGCAAY